MLSQTRKYGLYLGLAHQYWGQANAHLKEALQNAGIEVVFNVGRTDAEYTAKRLGRIDPLQVKHQVADTASVQRTHPTFYSLGEQWEAYAQQLQDLPPRAFLLMLRGQAARSGRTLTMRPPAVDPGELAAVEQEYLWRYFTAKADIHYQPAADPAVPVPATDNVGYQPVSIRARLLTAQG